MAMSIGNSFPQSERFLLTEPRPSGSGSPNPSRDRQERFPQSEPRPSERFPDPSRDRQSGSPNPSRDRQSGSPIRAATVRERFPDPSRDRQGAVSRSEPRPSGSGFLERLVARTEPHGAAAAPWISYTAPPLFTPPVG